MPSLNIFNPETTGVDMKSNPLFLGNKKLHAAVNMAFGEGRLRTRPGFVYHELGIEGQFQGACLFTPSLGLSSHSFGEASAALVTAAGGKVYANDTTWGEIACNPVIIGCGAGYAGRGEVHVFGAENYLIIQNRQSNTRWWTGSGATVESGGMEDNPYWVDADVPEIRFTPDYPAALPQQCDEFPCADQQCSLTLSVSAIVNANLATFSIYNSGTSAAAVTNLIADPAGSVIFDPPTATIEAGTGQDFTATAFGGYDLSTYGLGVTVENSCGGGLLAFTIGIPVPPCLLELLGVTSETVIEGTVTIKNTGANPATGIQIIPADLSTWGFSPSSPFSLGAGETLEITVSHASSLPAAFTITSDCAPDVGGAMPGVPDEECILEITGHTMTSGTSGTITIKNVGTADVSNILIVPNNGSPWVFDPALPVDMEPDDEITFTITSPEDMRLLDYWVYSDCAPTLHGLTNDYP